MSAPFVHIPRPPIGGVSGDSVRVRGTLIAIERGNWVIQFDGPTAGYNASILVFDNGYRVASAWPYETAEIEYAAALAHAKDTARISATLESDQ